jgi:hypothetical protein
MCSNKKYFNSKAIPELFVLKIIILGCEGIEHCHMLLTRYGVWIGN